MIEYIEERHCEDHSTLETAFRLAQENRNTDPSDIKRMCIYNCQVDPRQPRVRSLEVPVLPVGGTKTRRNGPLVPYLLVAAGHPLAHATGAYSGELNMKLNPKHDQMGLVSKCLH